MPRPRRPDLAVIEARVINWAAVYGGGLPDPTRQPSERRTPNELDAAVVEREMVALKRFRSRTLWPVVRAKYLIGYMDETGAQWARMPLRTYQDRVVQALRFLRGRLGG